MTFEETVTDDLMQVKLEREEGFIRVSFSGKCMYPAPPQRIIQLIDACHAELLAEKVDQVVLDVRPLDYANSSGMKIFLHWGVCMRNAKPGEGYKLLYLCNEQSGWQQLSFAQLGMLAPNAITVEYELPDN